MSCETATGPIDIIPTNKTCNLKCFFKYKYYPGVVIAKNNSDYIQLKVLDTDAASVKYSASGSRGTCNKNSIGGDYVIDEIRIYTPSLHTYNNSLADGEIIISHTNITGGTNLLVCIPISNGAGTQGKASNQLNLIVNEMINLGNSSNEGGIIQGLKFDLNNFIPQKGFYSYIATLPYFPCDKCVYYIVFDKSEASVGINNAALEKLQSIIKKNMVAPPRSISTLGYISKVEGDPTGIKKNLAYAYNKTGPKYATVNNDEIWIDCQPTGSKDEVIIEESKTNYLSGVDMPSSTVNFNWWKLFLIIITILLIMGACHIIICFFTGNISFYSMKWKRDESASS